MSGKPKNQPSKSQPINPAPPGNANRPALEQSSKGGPDSLIRNSAGQVVIGHQSHQQLEIHEEFSLSHHSGPLPHPETLRQYEGILPGAAERIMRMGESELNHRHAMERKSENRATGGVIAAFFIAAGGFLVSAYGFSLGYPVEAVSGVVGTLTAITGAFVYGTKIGSSKKDSEE